MGRHGASQNHLLPELFLPGIIAVAFALFYFIARYMFWNTGVSWATHFFKIERAAGQPVLDHGRNFIRTENYNGL